MKTTQKQFKYCIMYKILRSFNINNIYCFLKQTLMNQKKCFIHTIKNMSNKI